MGRLIKDNLMYFSHDAKAYDNKKFAALRAHYGGMKGWAMDARFWALNCLIADSDGCRLDMTTNLTRVDVARKLELSLEELDEFVSFLSDPDACDLLHNDAGVLWTERCQEELERVRKKREEDRSRIAATRGRQSGNRHLVGSDNSITGPDSPPEMPLSGVNSTAQNTAGQDNKKQQSTAQNDQAADPREGQPMDLPHLRKILVKAGILLDNTQLPDLLKELPGTDADARSCLDYMLERLGSAHNVLKPTPYFLKVYPLWIAEWAAGKRPSPRQPPTVQKTEPAPALSVEEQIRQGSSAFAREVLAPRAEREKATQPSQPHGGPSPPAGAPGDEILF